MAGKEIRLHVDKTSQLDGAFKAGDKIEAQATEKNHALRPCFPRVQSDYHGDFTLRLSQPIRLVKRVLSIDLLPTKVQNCVGLGRPSQR
jgi:hypothetical protein